VEPLDYIASKMALHSVIAPIFLNLKDAYFSVPIFSPHKKYLHFVWKGVIFQFTCLPFGLAPRVFLRFLNQFSHPLDLRESG